MVNASHISEVNISGDDEEILNRMLDGAEVVAEASVDTSLSAEQQANLTRLALKRKIEEAAEVDVISKDLPSKLRIKPDDPEDVKELTQNKDQNAGQQFQTTKGKSIKQVGFFTGREREYIQNSSRCQR